MIVYLETNFLLELAFQREQAHSCRQILDWCVEKRLDLRFPSFALVEARWALRRREADRDGLIQRLRNQEREFDRLHGSETLASACRDAGRAVIMSINHERAALDLVLHEVRRNASFAPLDNKVAEYSEMLFAFDALSGDSDLVILASLLGDLITRSKKPPLEPSLFLTRDADFGARTRTWLRPYSCDLLNSYEAAVGRLKESLP